MWKFLPNKLFKGVIPPSKECDPPPPFKMTHQICRITVFGGHCWFECSFFPVMFHINKNYLKLSFHWYQYLYVCAILLNYRWSRIPVHLTSPFLTAVEKLWSITLMFMRTDQLFSIIIASSLSGTKSFPCWEQWFGLVTKCKFE